MIDHYDWPGGREAVLRFGPAGGPVVIVAMPLFEEANRTRAFVVTICRALAERGVASAVPDLPGQGESLVPLENTLLADWQSAFAAAVNTLGSDQTYGVALRGGALIDATAELTARWHFAPMLGEAARRELVRTARAADPQRGDLDPIDLDHNAPIEIAGNVIAPALLRDLGTAHPAVARVIRLASDPGDAALKIDGAPLWRRSEPGNDPVLAALLADDIADWIIRCEG